MLWWTSWGRDETPALPAPHPKCKKRWVGLKFWWTKAPWDLDMTFFGLPVVLRVLWTRHHCPWFLAVSSRLLGSNVLVPLVPVINEHKPGGLKQKKFIVSQFSRLEVWNQGVDRAMFHLKALGRNLSCPFQLLRAPVFWLWQHDSSLCLLLYMITFSLCLWPNFLLTRTPVILD